MESRAKELIEMIASPQLLTLAVRYASQLGRIHLSEKLEEMRQIFEDQDRENEKTIQQDEITNICDSPAIVNRSILVETPNQEIIPVTIEKIYLNKIRF